MLFQILEILMVIVFVLFFVISPLTIQYLLFLPAKMIFKKTPTHILYAACFLLNTVLLIVLHYIMSTWDDPAEMKPMDAFDGMIWYLLWLPWYIGVLISCAVRMIRSKKK